MNVRDKQIIEHMTRYCGEIIGASKRFNDSKEQFMEDYVFYNSCCMSIFQIGEISKRLSDDFRESHPDLPWREIRGMRNLFAHEYESVNRELIWETIQKDIPTLHEQLKAILGETGE